MKGFLYNSAIPPRSAPSAKILMGRSVYAIVRLWTLVAATSATTGALRFGPPTKADFFLAGFTGPIDPAWLNPGYRNG
jgi:hypothetical protein